MFRGDRGRVYAFALILFLFISGGVAAWLLNEANTLQRGHEQEAKAATDQYARAADIAVERRCRPLPPQAEAQCISEERETARQRQREEYDLEGHITPLPRVRRGLRGAF